ncbi:MAG: hypothetical protein QXR18_02815 [Pyrobaculum sp.]
MSQTDDLERALSTVLRRLGTEAAHGLFLWLMFKAGDNVIAPAFQKVIATIQSGRQPSPQEIEQLQRILAQYTQQTSTVQQHDLNKLVDAIVERLKTSGIVTQQQHSQHGAISHIPPPQYSPAYSPQPRELARQQYELIRHEYENLRRIYVKLQEEYYLELNEEKRKSIRQRMDEVQTRLMELERRLLEIERYGY